jgi:hypothetical protein
VSKKRLKYFFFSILEHQFQALVRRPSMHEPPSSPSPSKACLKKSHRISSFAACSEPYSLAMYLRRRGRQRGSRQAVHILHLATEARAKATARREEKKRTRIRKIRQKQASRAAAAAARPACLPACARTYGCVLGFSQTASKPSIHCAIGARMRATCVYLSMKTRAFGTSRSPRCTTDRPTQLPQRR